MFPPWRSMRLVSTWPLPLAWVLGVKKDEGLALCALFMISSALIMAPPWLTSSLEVFWRMEALEGNSSILFYILRDLPPCPSAKTRVTCYWSESGTALIFLRGARLGYSTDLFMDISDFD